MSQKVKNINNTSDTTCECGTWLKHWVNFSKQALPTFCPEVKCMNPVEVGAHVQKESLIDKNWYIIPLCKEHNAKKGETIEITNNINFVPANKSETCD